MESSLGIPRLLRCQSRLGCCCLIMELCSCSFGSFSDATLGLCFHFNILSRWLQKTRRAQRFICQKAPRSRDTYSIDDMGNADGGDVSRSSDIPFVGIAMPCQHLYAGDEYFSKIRQAMRRCYAIEFLFDFRRLFCSSSRR